MPVKVARFESSVQGTTLRSRPSWPVDVRSPSRSEGVDPVAGLERLLEVVTAPTGEAVRFLAATMGTGSAWISRAETEEVIAFLQEWLAATEERAAAAERDASAK